MLFRFLTTSSAWLPGSTQQRGAVPHLPHAQYTGNTGLHSHAQITPATWLSALIAISLFALTAPITEEALAGYSVVSIGAGRGFIGGAIAIMVIQFSGWRLPGRSALLWIALSSPGLVFGFPLLITWALTQASSADVGVVLAALPMLTSAMSSLINRRPMTARFWFWAMAGMALTMGYFMTQSDWSRSAWSQSNWSQSNWSQSDSLQDSSTQWILLGALLSSSWGYAAGAKAAQCIGGWQTICWGQALTAPVCALLFGWSLGHQSAHDTVTTMGSTLALFYLGIFSQLIGFRFWFQALAVDTPRVSQIQLLQPILTLLALACFWGAEIGNGQWLAAVGILVCVLGAMRRQ